jgi:hypothetical protein
MLEFVESLVAGDEIPATAAPAALCARLGFFYAPPCSGRRKENTPMTSDTSQIIVTTESQIYNSIHGLSVRHRDFPEIRGEGSSPEDAAARLAERLTRTLDSAPSDWRRGIIERAIEDVRAFTLRRRPGRERSELKPRT